MTTLFRQGVESVCKGRRERGRQSASALVQKEAQVGLEAGKGRAQSWGWGWGWGGIKRKSRHRAVSGSQSWRPGRHFSFMYSKPLVPPGI